MARVWHKCIPPKTLHETFGVYNGIWTKQMDRYWESEDGYTAMSRQIRTTWGTVEHVAIERKPCGGDIPWSVKQEIKNELFGQDRIAIEVFPSRKNLIDIMDIYHLWVLPKDMRLPFGIHPYKDVQCKPVERGYDFDLEESRAWVESEKRNELMGSLEEGLEKIKEKLIENDNADM